MDKIKLIVKGNPITKKNHSQIAKSKSGKVFIVPSKQYKSYSPGFIEECQIQHVYQKNINTPVNIKCSYYMETRRKVDLTNLLAATDDLLVKAGVIEDDNCTIVVGHDGSRVYYDKNNPRVEIEISEGEEVFK